MMHEFHFAGGCRDGAVYRSFAADEAERREATRLWEDFGGAREGVKRPVLTPDVILFLNAGKHKDVSKIKEHAQTYQVVSHRLEQGVEVIRCQQIADEDLG